MVPERLARPLAVGRDRAEQLAAAAVVVGLLVIVCLTRSASALERLAGVAGAASMVSLAWRQVRPATVTILVAGGVIGTAAASSASGPVLFAVLILSSYSVAAHGRGYRVALALLASTGAVTAAVSFAPSTQGSRPATAVFFTALLVAAPAVAGLVARARLSLAGHVRAAAAPEVATADDDAAARRLAAALRTTLVVGIEGLRDLGRIDSLAAVADVERIARRSLASMRELAHDLRSDSPGLDATATANPERTLERLQHRVDALVVSAPLVSFEHRLGRSTLLSGAGADATLAAVAAGLALWSAWGQPTVGRAVLAAAVSIPLAAGRRWLPGAVLATAVLLVAYTAVAAPSDALGGPASAGVQLVLPFAAGVWGGPWRRTAVLGACLATTLVVPLVTAGGYPAAEVGGALAVEVGCWALGRAARLAVRRVSDAASTAELRAAEQTRLRRTAERARLARDLHDAIAHSMTVVVLHAAAARRVWSSDPVQRDAHLGVLAETLDTTLGGLGALVSRLETGPVEAVPSVAETLPQLCRHAEEAGLRVRLVLENVDPAEIGELPTRVVREALTNAVRYAPGSDVRLTMTGADSGITLEVSNGPARRAPEHGLGAGLGLAGLRDRLTELGGELDTGAVSDGGFRVRATIPEAAATP